MSNELQFLIERASKYKMTEQEKNEQIRSFAYGNTNIENEGITKADIERAEESLKSPEVASVYS